MFCLVKWRDIDEWDEKVLTQLTFSSNLPQSFSVILRLSALYLRISALRLPTVLLTPQKTEETARHLRQYASMHYNDVRMDVIASQITSLTIVYSTVYSGADQRKHQRSASLAFVRGIHRRPVNFPHKWPVTRKMFPLDDAIMIIGNVPQTDTLGAGQNGRNFCKRHFQIHLLEKKSMNFYHE